MMAYLSSFYGTVESAHRTFQDDEFLPLLPRDGRLRQKPARGRPELRPGDPFPVWPRAARPGLLHLPHRLHDVRRRQLQAARAETPLRLLHWKAVTADQTLPAVQQP